MRDGLSMLDQAIAHGGGSVVDAAQVRDMLGLADRSRVLELFEKAMKGDAPAVVASLGEMHDSRRRPRGGPARTCSSSRTWVTRLKVAPEAAASSADSEAAPRVWRWPAQAFHGVAHAGLDAAAERPAGNPGRASPPLRAAEMALIRLLLCGRPALARRCH